MKRASLPFIDLQAQYRRLRDTIDARVRAVLEHGAYILGPEVTELEQALAAFTGSPEVVAVSSGSDALLIALLDAGLARNDAVFLPAFTFPATPAQVLLAGGTPVFVDVAPDTFNMDPASLEERIHEVERAGKLRPAVILPADMFGVPADYAALRAIADRHGCLLMADGCQSLGATVNGQAVGTLAPITAVSFYPSKPLGCYGDGGALFVEHPARAARLRSLRVHGESGGRYRIETLGINGRLDTLQAAVLLAKLTVFREELDQREQVAQWYDASLAGCARLPARPDGVRSSWAQYSILVENRDAVVAALADAGIPTAVHYPVPLHLQPAFESYGAGEGSLPVAEDLCRRVMSLPMHPYLARGTVEHIAAALRAAVAGS